MPAALPVSLDELITFVHGRASADDPLAQLAAASELKDELAERADALLGHFVDRARHAGCSWSQIGDALGVSKQAVQQRHGRPVIVVEGLFERFTPRTRAAITAAERAAAALGHNYLGTEHLLLGILGVPDSVAAVVLAAAGVDEARATNAILELVPRGGATATGSVPFTPRAKSVLDRTLTEAVDLGHNYVGTEHLLLALFHDEASVAAKVLVGFGLAAAGVRDRLVAEILQRTGTA